MSVTSELDTFFDECRGNVNKDGDAAKSTNFVISSKVFFSSDIDGMCESATPILNFKIGTCRMITIDTTGELSGDGRITGKDTLVCMKYGTWAPRLQDYMWTGKIINGDNTIIIKRLSSIMGASGSSGSPTSKVTQEVAFSNAFIKEYRQMDDLIAFSFVYSGVQDTNKLYEDAGNVMPSGGNVVAGMNFAEMSSIFGKGG